MASSDMASSFFKTGCKDTGRFAYFLIVVRKTIHFYTGRTRIIYAALRGFLCFKYFDRYDQIILWIKKRTLPPTIRNER